VVSVLESLENERKQCLDNVIESQKTGATKVLNTTCEYIKV
jgi:hypothetical protein